jgi:hypothetical protein
MSYNGVPLVVLPPSMTLVLSADPACTVPDGDKLYYLPAWPTPAAISAPSPDMPQITTSTSTSPLGPRPNPDLQPGTPITIATATGLLLQIDSKTGLLVFALPGATGAPDASTFILLNPDDPFKAVQPGDPVVLTSAATGKHCAFDQAVPESLLSLPHDDDRRRRELLTHKSLPQSCGIKCMACYIENIKQASKLRYRWVLLCPPSQGKG